MIKQEIIFLILGLCFLIAIPVSAQTATEIVKMSDDLMRGETNQGRYKMSIQTPNWERTLELDVHSKGREHMLINIVSPAKEAGIRSLRIKNEMWNYLPAVERVIKIPPSMMLQPWMGSDFANDDLVKESSIVNDYTHTILKEEICAGDESYQIELIPKPDAPVIWGKILRWIRKSDYVPLKEEYYNERGKKIKTLTYSNIGQVSDRVIPKTWTMTSHLKEGQSTTIELLDVTYNEPIADNIFSLTNLNRIQ